MSLPTKEEMSARMQAHADHMLSKPIVKHDWQVKNCISYWYPKLLSTIVNMPQTIIIRPDVGLYELANLLDGKPSDELLDKADELVRSITHACGRLGYPAFLRTGDFSGKHEWDRTCYLANERTNVKHHLGALIEGAALRDLPLDVFAVREFLPTVPLFHAFSGKMPITRERRFFIKDGKILGSVAYWPENAFEGQWTSIHDWQPVVRQLESEPDLAELERLTSFAASALEGEWSVDWLWTKRGWYLTDCALGPMSWGWDKVCPKAKDEHQDCD